MIRETKCPRCNEPSPLTDWCKVDIGVGTQIWDEQYTCPTHGTFGFVLPGGEVVFQEDAPEHVPDQDEIEFIKEFGPK
jgi:hypothetical protein